MIVSGGITIYAIRDAEITRVHLSTSTIVVDPYNVQAEPLIIQVQKVSGADTKVVSAYISVQAYSLNRPIEGAVVDFGYCSEASFTIPARDALYATATAVKVCAYSDAAKEKLVDSAVVGVICNKEPGLLYRGTEWTSGSVYRNGDFLEHKVGEISSIYVWSSRVEGNTSKAPWDITSTTDPDYGYWTHVTEQILFISKMIMANFAKLGSAIFSGNFTISEHGLSKGTNPETGKPYDYRDFDAAMSKFAPNFMIDWLSGKVTGKDIDMQGGNIGGFELTGFNLRNKNGKDCWVSIQTNDGDNTRISSLGNCFPSVLGYSVAGYYESSGTSTNKALVLRAFGSKNPVGISDKFENHCIDAIGGVNWHMDGKDHWCMPGVLYAAHFGGGGELYEDWGDGVEIKVADIEHPSTGTYSITHNIGHMSYFVAITPMRNWTFATLQHKNANSFGFTIADANRGLIDSEFDLVIFGRPFVKNK